MKSYLIEFGLTPASRTKLKIAPKPVEDPMAKFLNENGAANPTGPSDGQPAVSAYFKTGVPDIGRTDA